MASKVKGNTPEFYQGLAQVAGNINKCILEDQNMVFSMFDNRKQLEGLESYESLIKPTIQKVWDNFNNFADTTNEQTTLAYHEELFKAPAPKKQDLTITKLLVWHKICSIVKNDMSAKPGSATTDPKTGRKSTIGTRKYFLGEVTEGTGDIKTYQALKCIELFRNGLEKCGTDENGKRIITEAALKQYVEDNAAILKTRQDPWRIFQYYRPQLLKAKLLRHD